MPPVLFCPERAVLERLLLGQLAGSDEVMLGQHVKACPLCRATVVDLMADDTVVEAIRAREKPQEGPRADPVLQLVAGLHRAADDGASAKPPEAIPLVSAPALDATTFLAPSQAEDELGRLGDYRVLRVLGAGGMGMVFEGEDVRLKRRVALKVMKPEWAANEGARQRFVREAQAAAKVKSDHIVTIYQVGEDQGVPYLAMEFLQGEAMDHWLKRGRRPNLAQVIKLAREMALGLVAAHERGLVHRDIKPGNIWLESPTGRVKILDFGLARAPRDDIHLTRSGAIVGTPAYMAPEQARGEAVDHRCDLFSLGCVLYRLTTGKMPFRGDTTMAILMALATEQPRPVRAVSPEVPQPLADLIERLLAKDPAQRPASARAVVQALEAVKQTLAGASTPPMAIPVAIPVAAPAAELSQTAALPPMASLAASSLLKAVTAPTEPLPPRRRRKRRRPVLIAVAAGIVCSLLLIGVIAHFIGKDDDGPAAKPEPNPPPSKDSASKVGGGTPSRPAGPEIGPMMAVEPVTLTFDPKVIPAEDRFAWQPKNLVAILGDHRVRHGGLTSCLALSPDGKLVATTYGPQLTLSDAETLHVKTELSADGPPIACVAWSSDGKKLATSRVDNLGTVQLWDVASGTVSKTIQAGKVQQIALAFAHDGKRLATVGSGDKAVKLWDLESGTEPKSLEGYPAPINVIAFTPDGNELLAGGGPPEGADNKKTTDCAVWSFDVTSGKKLRAYEGPTRPIISLAVSAEGTRILVGCEGHGLWLWDRATAKATPLDDGTTKRWPAVAFTRDGRYAVSLMAPSSFTFWDLEGKRPLTEWSWPEPVGGLAFLPDGGRVLAAVGNTLRLWVPTLRKEPRLSLGHTTALACLALSRDGRFLLSCGMDGTLRLWDLTAGSAPRWLRGVSAQPLTERATFSPDGRLILLMDLVSGTTYTWRLWELKDGRELLARSFPLQGLVRNPLTFAPNGKWFLAPSEKNGAPILHGVDNDKRIAWPKAIAEPVAQALFCADGKQLLTVDPTGVARVWDVATAKELRRVEAGNAQVMIAPDGRTLFLGCQDAWVRTIDLTDKAPVARELGLRYHTAAITSLAIAPDGRTLASSGGDGRVVVWDVANRVRLFEWQHPAGPVSQVLFAPDGRHLIAANNDGTIHIVRMEPNS